jgi:hypothetical protein
MVRDDMVIYLSECQIYCRVAVDRQKPYKPYAACRDQFSRVVNWRRPEAHIQQSMFK